MSAKESVIILIKRAKVGGKGLFRRVKMLSHRTLIIHVNKGKIRNLKFLKFKIWDKFENLRSLWGTYLKFLKHKVGLNSYFKKLEDRFEILERSFKRLTGGPAK